VLPCLGASGQLSAGGAGARWTIPLANVEPARLTWIKAMVRKSVIGSSVAL